MVKLLLLNISALSLRWSADPNGIKFCTSSSWPVSGLVQFNSSQRQSALSSYGCPGVDTNTTGFEMGSNVMGHSILLSVVSDGNKHTQ